MHRLTRPFSAHFRAVLVLAPLLIGALACDASTPVVDTPSNLDVDVDGLTLTRWTSSRVEGEYTQDSATVLFAVERDGTRRTATIRATDGAPLFASALDGGIETVTLFGGRAVLTGTVDELDPELDGDSAAIDELAAMPESACVGRLRGALLEAGVDDDLVGVEPSEDTITPRDGWATLGPGESAYFPTWSWWGWTNVSMSLYLTYSNPPMVYGCVRLTVRNQSEKLCASWNQAASVARQWAGYTLQVTNIHASWDYMQVHVW